jgi:hypothetical protein
MKYISVLFLFFGLNFAVNIQARTKAELKDDFIKVTNKTVKIYSENGMSGLIAETEECYRDAKENPLDCVHLDLASRHIDQLMVAGAAKQGVAFPKIDFFEDELFGRRVMPVFMQANMDMEASNEYLRLVTPVINRLVRDRMFSLPSSTGIGREGIYVAYDNGIVRDTVTGLEWVSGPDRDMDWNEAKSWVESLNVGGGGWRLPTMDELKGLYKNRSGKRNMPSLLKTTGLYVWSEKVQGSSNAWFFNFTVGQDKWIYRHTASSVSSRAFAVRFRKNGPREAKKRRTEVVSSVEESAPKRPLVSSNEIVRDGVYVAYGNGIVIDTGTGLEWVAGPDEDKNFKQAKSWVKALNIDGGGWRMPTKDELKGLYKDGTGDRNMTSLLKTTGWWVWSEKPGGSYFSEGFYFADGPRPWITRFFSANRRAFAVRSRNDAVTVRPSAQETMHQVNKGIEAKQPATAESVDRPLLYPGDTYIIESIYNANPKLNNVTERRIISVDASKVVMTSQSIESKNKTIRTLEFTPEWNLLRTRNANGSGIDFSPPLKYYEFPLFPGKTWKQTSVATNVKTGATREFSLSGIVGAWEAISVPAGTFKGIKVTLNSEIFIPATGKKSSGTDTSWYVPELRRSVKSEMTSRNSEGIERGQLIQLRQYKLNHLYQ